MVNMTACVLLLSAPLWAQSFDTNRKINPTDANAQQDVCVQTGSDGLLYAVWSHYDGTDFDVRFAKSSDGGRTWSAPVEISDVADNNVNDTVPRLAIQGTGSTAKVYVVWKQYVGAADDDMPIKYSADGGGTFASGGTFALGVFPLASPDVVADASDPLVAYASCAITNTSTAGGTSDVLWARTLDGGPTWTGWGLDFGNYTGPPNAIDNYSNAITLSGTGATAISNAFFQGRFSATDHDVGRLQVTSPQAATPTFTLAWVVITASDHRIVSGCAKANGATVHLAYFVVLSGTDHDVYYRISTDSGLTWTANSVAVSTDAQIETNPRIDFGSAGTDLYIVYQEDSSGNYQIMIRRSTDTGATWLAEEGPVNDDGAGVANVNPDIAVTRGGNVDKVNLSWNDPRSGNEDAYYSFYYGDSITGTAYSSVGVAVGSGKKIHLLVNGVIVHSTTTDGAGAFTLRAPSDADDLLTAFFDGETEKGVTVTVTTGANLAGFHVWNNRVTIRSDNLGSTSNANLDTAHNGDSDIPFTNGGGTTLTAGAGTEIYVAVGTHSPGGAVNGTHVAIASGAEIKAGPGVVITLSGNWTNDGLFNQGTSSVVFNGASGTQTIGGSSNTTFYDLTISGAATRQFADTANSGRAFETTNIFTWTDGDLIVGNLTGATTAIVRNTSATAASANVTIPSARKLTVRGGSTLWIGGAYAASTGIRINGGFTLTATGTASIDLGDSWTNDGTFTANSSTVTFYGISIPSVAITGSSNTAFNILNLGTTMTSGSKTVNIGHTTAGSVLTTTAATLTIGSTTAGVTVAARLGNNGAADNTNGQVLTVSGDLTINGTGTNSLAPVSFYSHAINVGGNWTNNGTYASVAGTNSETITFNGAGGATFGGTSATTAYRVTINKGAGATTVTQNSALTVNNNLTLTQGTWTSAANLTVSGTCSWTTANSATLNLTAGTVSLGAVSQQPFTAGQSRLTISGAGTTVSISGNHIIGTSGVTTDNTTVSRCDISGGTVNYTGTGGSVNLQLGSMGATASRGWYATGGAISFAGSITSFTRTIFQASGTAAISFTGSANSTVSVTSAAASTPANSWTFNGITVAKTGGATLTFQSGGAGPTALDASVFTGAIVVDAGAGLTLNAKFTTPASQGFVATSVTNNGTLTVSVTHNDNLWVSGNWTNSGTFTSGSGTVTFNGGAPQTITSGGIGGGKNFYALTVNQSPASTVTLLTNPIETKLDLTLTSGTLDLGAVAGNLVDSNLVINGGALTFGTAAQNPSVAVAGNFSKSSGSITMNSATDTLDVDGSFTVTGGTGSLTSGILYAAGNVAVSGDGSFVSTFALFYLDGSTDTTVTLTGASNTFGFMAVLKSGPANKVTTAGAVTSVGITVEEGIFEILAHTVSMTGTTTFDITSGGELRMQTAGGLLDLAGFFRMQVSAAVTISDGTIRVGRNFESTGAGAAFDPTGGTVEFRGASGVVHDVSIDAGDNFHHLTIAPQGGAVVWRPATTATLDVNGNFTILAAPSGASCVVNMLNGANQFTMELAGSFAMVTGAVPSTFAPSAVIHRVDRDWDDSGGVFQPTAGGIRFDTSVNAAMTVGAANRFFDLYIKKNTIFVSGTMTVQDASSDVTVRGNVTLETGTFDVNGKTVSVGGNWIETAGVFQPTAGTVTFNATAPATQTITAQSFNYFRNLTLNQPGGTPGVNALDLQSNVKVTGALDVTAGRMNIRGYTLELSATGVLHQIGANGALRHFKNAEASGASNSTLLLGNLSSMNVSGWYIARYSLVSGDTGRAIVDAVGGGANRYLISINAGGNLWARQARFNRLEESGLTIAAGAYFNELYDVIFDVGTVGGVYLNLEGVTGDSRISVPYSAHKIQFLAGTTYNVKAGLGTPPIRFHGATGALAGEDYDNDPTENELSGGRVHWESGRIQNLTTLETFDSIEDAIADADTVSGHRIRCLTRCVIEGNYDFSVWGKDVILEQFVLHARSGNAVDGGSSLLGQLQNCAIAKGGADFVTLRNCTLFDPSAGTATVTNCAAHNSVFEEAAPGLSTDVNNRKGVAAAIFVDATGFDFHLVADDSASSQGSPAGWSGSAVDWELHARSGNWDRGFDEYVNIGVTKLPTDVGAVSRFHWIGGTRGSASAANGFAYLTSRKGSATPANDDTLYVINLSTMAVVTQAKAVGPILNLAFWVDVSNSGASWRAWIYLLVDSDYDGLGDAIQLVVDRGDAGLVHPNQPLADPDPYDRRFGNVDVYGDGSRYVYRPGAAGEHWIRTITLATVPSDGADDAPTIVYNSPAGTNKARWNRLFFAAYSTFSGFGELFKVNTDPYDANSASAPDNQAFGETIWSIAGSYNFDYEAPITFTWTSGFQEIFVSVSQNAAPAQTVLVRYGMVGTSAPAASRNWQATEEAAGVDENRYGATLDGGDTNASCVYGISDGTVIYNRTVDSASGNGGLRWASRLKNGAGTPQSPVLAPQRFFPNAFALVAYDGGVNKIWDIGGSDTKNGCLASSGLKLNLATAPTLDEIAVASTQDLDWPMACEGKPIQKIWVRGTKIYFGTDQGYVYGRNWNRDGSSTATGDETTVTGYPYQIPGGKITWIFVHPTAGVLVGTDTGGFYRFTP